MTRDTAVAGEHLLMVSALASWITVRVTHRGRCRTCHVVPVEAVGDACSPECWAVH